MARYLAVSCALFALVALVTPSSTCAQATKYGTFSGNPRTEWLNDGRRMILLDNFSFIEPDGTRWTAKAAHHPLRWSVAAGGR